MIEKLLPQREGSQETLTHSLVKTISYRLVIVIFDFIAIYLFTGQVKVAVGFMIISNIYTTAGYFLFERIWGQIAWGKTKRQT